MAGVVSLIVRLVDQFSREAPKVVGAIKNIDNAMGAAARTGSRFNGIGMRIAGIAAGAAGLGAVAAGVGRSLQATVRQSADFEDMLQGIAQTGDMTAAQLTSLRETILKLGPSIGRMPEQIGKVANDLVAAGISPDRVERMLTPIGRVAVATRSEIEDISKASQALFQNLEIAPDQLEAAFDKIWIAAKRGNFELKDMAQFLPAIAAAASSRGMKGMAAAVEIAAAAQIVREGAGSPGQAATNLKDLLLKTQSPEAVKKFKAVGIDIKKEIADGMAKGRSPLETVILQTRKALAENKGLNVGDLFQDQQAQLALVKLVEKYDEFIKIRNEAMGAKGTIDADFKVMSATLANSLKQMDAAIDERRKRWAKTLDPIEIWRADMYKRLNQWLGDLTTRFPRLSARLGMFSVAAADVLSVLGSLGPALLSIASTLAIAKFAGLGRLIAILGSIALAPVRFLAGFGIGFVGGLLRALAPLGPAILTGLVALGPWVLRGLAFLLRIFTGPVGWTLLAAELAWVFREPIMKALESLWNWVKESWSSLTDQLGSIDLSAIASRLGESLRSAFSNTEWATEIGRSIMNKLRDGLQSASAGVVSWVTGFIGRLKSLFSFNVSPTITPQGGGAPAITPQSAPGSLAPAPALGRQASITNYNQFTIQGSEGPEAVARRVVNALDRQRQAGLYDGALA